MNGKYAQNGFDELGRNKETGTLFNKDGFNKEGWHKKTRTKYNEEGFDISGRHKETGTWYNKEGFNKNGWNKETRTMYNEDGYDKDGYNEEGFNKEGYNKYGFNEEGIHKETGTRFDNNGFYESGRHKKTGTRYNEDGYDRDGYDRDGYNIKGFNRQGLFYGKKKRLYDNWGYDEQGYNEEGYDEEGYGADGYNKKGFNRQGINKDTGTKFNEKGFNAKGYDEKGFDKRGFNEEGIHKETGTLFNKDGFNKEGYNEEGYDEQGFNKKGIHRVTKTKYNEEGYNRDGYNIKGLDREGYRRSGFNIKGFNRQGIHRLTGTKFNTAGKTQEDLTDDSYKKEERRRKAFFGLKKEATNLANGKISVEDFMKTSKISLEDLITFARKIEMDYEIIDALEMKEKEYRMLLKRYDGRVQIGIIKDGKEIFATREDVKKCIKYLKSNNRLIREKTVHETVVMYLKGELDLGEGKKKQELDEGEKKQELDTLAETPKVVKRTNYLAKARDIKAWIENSGDTKPPSRRSKYEKERSLAYEWRKIKSQLIKPYLEMGTEEEKEQFRNEYPEIEEVIEIVNEIDKNNNIPPFLRNARKIKEWIENSKDTRPPSEEAKDKEEKKLGVALGTIRSQLIKPYLKLETEEEKKEYKEKHPELEEVLKIVNEIDKNNTPTFLRNARKIKEWIENSRDTKPPSLSSEDKEEKSLANHLRNIRNRLIKPYFEKKTEEEKEQYREEHPELDEVLEIVNEINMQYVSKNKKQQELAILINQDLEKRKALQEAKKLEQAYEQQLSIKKEKEHEGTKEQGVEVDE